MWESHLLKHSSWTPICHFSYLNISNRPLLTVSSHLPASSAPPHSFQLSAEGFFLFVCLCVRVIGPNFLLQFSSMSAQLPALACCSLVNQTHPKSASYVAAGGSFRPVLWISVTFILGADRADTSLNYFIEVLHITVLSDHEVVLS